NPITLKTPLPWTGRGQRVKSPVYFNNSAAVPTACPFPTVQSLYVGPSRPSPSWLPLEGTSAIAHTIVANASDKKSLSLRENWEYGCSGGFSFQRRRCVHESHLCFRIET